MYQDVTDEGLATLTVPQRRVCGCTSPTIYRVKVMFANEDNNLYPKPLECREEILLPVTPKELKSKLCEWWDTYLDDDAPYPMCFIVREIPLFTAHRLDASIREWIYKGDCLLSESLCCNNYGLEKFMGRPTELIRFKEGDLVNIVYDDHLAVGIVMSTPPTDTDIMQRFEEFRKGFAPTLPEASSWEAYRSFDSDPSTDCYRVLVAHSDNNLSLDNVPSSRVIKLLLHCHLPSELASILGFALQANNKQNNK